MLLWSGMAFPTLLSLVSTAHAPVSYSRLLNTSEVFSSAKKNPLLLAQFICFAQYLLKACIKGTIFALEELFPSVLVAVVAPDALDVTRRELAKFTVKDGFCFLHSCSTPWKWDWADVVVVPGQSCRLVVVQLLLNIRRLRVWRVCRETERSCYSRWINKSKKGLMMPAPEPTGFWRGLIKLLVMKLILLSEGIKRCSTS